MTNIVDINEHRILHPLFKVQVWRRQDGLICASVCDASPGFVSELPFEDAKDRSIACAGVLLTAKFLHPEDESD